MDAHAVRDRHYHNQAMQQAWMTAYLTRTKRLPPLERLMVKGKAESKERRLTKEGAAAEWRSLRRLG